MPYDAFISYSHEADEDLSSDLQLGLERFEKPWYRPRPFLRILRDVTSFSAGVELGQVITDGLDDSNHLVVLLSPEYAASEWTNRELEHWLAAKSSDDVTFAVTRWGDVSPDGEPIADLDDYQWAGADVPPAMRGHFAEPLAVDLRWATEPNSRTLENERWRDVVATIAASIRGQSKDELIGALVAMRTRARILTSAVVLGVLILLGAIAVSVPGWLAARSATNRAEAAAEVAQQDQASAEAAAAAAEQAAADARLLQSEAEGAASRAAAARQLAEEAQRVADEAKVVAEMALTDAELDLADAQQQQADAEAAQALAVMAQADAERAAAEAEQLQRDAEAAAALAEQLRQEAEAAAEEAAALAAAAAAEAERQLTIATSRTLAGQAQARVAKALDLASLLAVESYLTVEDLVGTAPSSDTDGGAAAVISEPRSALLASLLAAPALDAVVFRHESGAIIDLAAATDRPLLVGLVNAINDNTLQVWDTSRRETVTVIEDVDFEVPTAVAVTPNGDTIALVRSLSSSIALFDSMTGDGIGSICCHSSNIESLAIDGRGELVATGGSDGRIQIRRLDGGQLIDAPSVGHAGAVESVAFSSDRTKLATSGRDEQARIWQLQPDGSVCTACRLLTLEKHTAAVTAVALAPDGTLATGGEDAAIRLWDSTTGLELDNVSPLAGHIGTVTSLDFNATSELLTSASRDGTARLWDVNTGMQVGETFSGHLTTVSVVQFISDGRHLATGSFDGTVRLWDSANRGEIGEIIDGHDSDAAAVDISPSGRTIVASAEAKDGTGEVRLWDVGSGRAIGKLVDNGSEISAVEFSPNGTFIAVLGDRLQIWEADSASIVKRGAGGSAVAFAPHEDRIAVAEGDTVRLFSVPNLQATGVDFTADHAIEFLAFSRDGGMLAAGQPSTPRISLWDVDSGERKVLTLPEGDFGPSDIAFSQDGTELAVSFSSLSKVEVWNLAAAEITRTLQAEPVLWTVEYSPDGSMIAAGTSSGTIILWEADSGAAIADPLAGHSAPVFALAFSGDGGLIVSGARFDSSEEMRMLMVTNLTTSHWVDQACARANRNLTQAEWTTFKGSEPYRATCE